MTTSDSSRPATATVPWGQQASSSGPTPSGKVRLHRLVEGLPDWDPLPPGEILVVRPGRE